MAFLMQSTGKYNGENILPIQFDDLSCGPCASTIKLGRGAGTGSYDLELAASAGLHPLYSFSRDDRDFECALLPIYLRLLLMGPEVISLSFSALRMILLTNYIFYATP
jgi:hypothetical protein